MTAELIPDDYGHDVFWQTNEKLATVKRYAEASMVAPWALLGCLLARMMSTVHPTIQLPATVGAPASLNVFFALVAPSGGGKSSAEGASREYMRFEGETYVEIPSSGQGLAALFLELDPNASSKKEAELIRNGRVGAMLNVDEVAHLKAMDQPGSSLATTLRTAWSGGTLGSANADVARRRRVEAHTYRLTGLFGVQERRAAILADDADGGTPQRIVWLPATNPDAEEPSDDELKWRDARIRPTWKYCAEVEAKLDGPRFLISVCGRARSAIRAARLSGLRGEDNDGQKLLLRLKVAVALALFCTGHSAVTDEFWELSGFVMAVSEETFAGVLADVEADRIASGKRAGIEWGAKTAQAAETQDKLTDDRIRGLIKKHIQAAGRISTGDLSRKMSGRDKRVRPDGSSAFMDALQAMVNEGIVRALNDKKSDGQDVQWLSWV